MPYLNILFIYSTPKHVEANNGYHVNLFAGKGISWSQITCSFFKWHKNSSKTVAQACKCSSHDCDPNCHSSFVGICNNKSPCVYLISAVTGGFYVWKYLQDNLWINHICICNASFRRWWPLCCWWRAGNLRTNCIDFSIKSYNLMLDAILADGCRRNEYTDNYISEIW